MFNLPGKKAVQSPNPKIEKVVVEVREHEVVYESGSGDQMMIISPTVYQEYSLI